FTDAEVYQLYASNLYKFNQSMWYLFVNQSKNTSDGLDHGNYTYLASAKNTTGWENMTDVRTINVNTVPTITFVTPANNTNTTDINLDVNFTISDTNGLSSCWYSNDSYTVNITFACGQNITNVTWSEAKHNVTVYSNDTNSNLAQKSIVFTVDITNPNVTLILPENQTSYTTSSQEIGFQFNVTDNQYIANCSLIINSVVNLTNSTINKSILNNLTQTFSVGTYNWSVNCTDYSTNRFGSASRIFTVIAPASSGGSSSESGGPSRSSSGEKNENERSEEEEQSDLAGSSEWNIQRSRDVGKTGLHTLFGPLGNCRNDFSCGEWSACKADYSTAGLVSGNIILPGVQERLCTHTCFVDKIEQQVCELKADITSKKIAENAVEIYKAEDLVSTIERVRDRELNVVFYY
ncbi:MAG: hypothetical protein RL557_392, partial [archaeon]